MKILDKLKNALFEEEYVEVEEKPVARKEKAKEKPIAKKIVMPKEDPVVEMEEPQEEKKSFVFPVIDEEDFVDLTDKKKEEAPKKEETSPPSDFLYEEEKPYHDAYSKNSNYFDQKVSEPPLYSSGNRKEPQIQMHEYGYEKKKDKQSFTPSPIISPIYGILDKNYKKEDVVSKKEVRLSNYGTPSNKIDLDAVRAKAYGETDDSIFEEELTEEKISESRPSLIAEEQDEDTLLDISADKTPTVAKVTVGDAEEYFQDLGLEYNIDYKDASKEKATGRRSDLRNDDRDDAPIEENLFDLIDTMYEEREGE